MLQYVSVKEKDGVKYKLMLDTVRLKHVLEVNGQIKDFSRREWLDLWRPKDTTEPDEIESDAANDVVNTTPVNDKTKTKDNNVNG